jgi:hypothetical protein
VPFLKETFLFPIQPSSICPIQKENLEIHTAAKARKFQETRYSRHCLFVLWKPESFEFNGQSRLKVAKVAVRSVILCRDGPQAKGIQRMGAPS